MNKDLSHALKFSLISLAVASSFNVSANIGEDVSKAVKDSKVDVSLRYRVETVDQDGVDEDALASTLKSRLTVTTGKVANFSGKVEVDDVSAVGNDSYNSTVNGETNYPVVADPEGSEVPVLDSESHLQNSANHFVHVINKDAEPWMLCNPTISRNAQEILEAGLRSAKSGEHKDLPL